MTNIGLLPPVRINFLDWGRTVYAAWSGKQLNQIIAMLRSANPRMAWSTAKAIAKRAIKAVEIGVSYSRLPAYARIEEHEIPRITGLRGRYQGQQAQGFHYAVDLTFDTGGGQTIVRRLNVVADDVLTRNELRKTVRDALSRLTNWQLPGSLPQLSSAYRMTGMNVISVVRVV